jgi:DNA (cytosine-5)-methyltransferase 1
LLGADFRAFSIFLRGVGGLSLGFQSAGFKIAAAVEFDPFAAASHGRNFHRGDPRHSKARDITKLSPEALLPKLKSGQGGAASQPWSG